MRKVSLTQERSQLDHEPALRRLSKPLLQKIEAIKEDKILDQVNKSLKFIKNNY